MSPKLLMFHAKFYSPPQHAKPVTSHTKVLFSGATCQARDISCDVYKSCANTSKDALEAAVVTIKLWILAITMNAYFVKAYVLLCTRTCIRALLWAYYIQYLAMASGSGSMYVESTKAYPETIDPLQHEELTDVAGNVTYHTQYPSKKSISVVSRVRELLDCPVCFKAMHPPIHQCSNGHTLCSVCKSTVHNQCPTCKQELGDIRCLALEKASGFLELPCQYQSYGCMGIYPYYYSLEHEAQCVYRPYSCPYAISECTIEGNIPHLVNHLRDDHKVFMHTGRNFTHRYVKSNPVEVENLTWMITVINCFGHYFCLHFEGFQLGTAPVYIAFLRFMGDDSEAKNFRYSLEVGYMRRKMIWQGVPRSIRDSNTKVRDNFDGLIVQRNVALFFSGGDRKELKLMVTGKIWKEH